MSLRRYVSARSPVAIAVITAAANDLLAGIDHAGPRAFTQAHFDGTKAHDVRGVLAAAGVPTCGDRTARASTRRPDRARRTDRASPRPTARSTSSPLRGPVGIRLDQPNLEISTTAGTVVVIENLQPAEVVCARTRPAGDLHRRSVRRRRRSPPRVSWRRPASGCRGGRRRRPRWCSHRPTSSRGGAGRPRSSTSAGGRTTAGAVPARRARNAWVARARRRPARWVVRRERCSIAATRSSRSWRPSTSCAS